MTELPRARISRIASRIRRRRSSLQNAGGGAAIGIVFTISPPAEL